MKIFKSKSFKKLSALVLAVALAMSCTVAANAYVRKQGDLDGDGMITVSDVTMLQRMVSGTLESSGMLSVIAELNGDGVISVADATFLQQSIVGLNPTPVGFVPMDGIDVSKWQGEIDFEQVKADGYDFVIIRAGYGNEISQKDVYFEQNYAAAKKAGLYVGAYWYSYAADESDAELEAEVFREAIAGKTFELPVFLDVEDSLHTNYTKSKLTSIVNAFADSMTEYNYYVGVYSNQYFFNNLIDLSSLDNVQTVWLAEYDDEMNIECDVWQYASDGTVSGISGDCDMNKCLVDYPTIITQNGYNGY